MLVDKFKSEQSREMLYFLPSVVYRTVPYVEQQGLCLSSEYEMKMLQLHFIFEFITLKVGV